MYMFVNIGTNEMIGDSSHEVCLSKVIMSSANMADVTLSWVDSYCINCQLCLSL